MHKPEATSVYLTLRKTRFEGEAATVETLKENTRRALKSATFIDNHDANMASIDFQQYLTDSPTFWAIEAPTHHPPTNTIDLVKRVITISPHIKPFVFVSDKAHSRPFTIQLPTPEGTDSLKRRLEEFKIAYGVFQDDDLLMAMPCWLEFLQN